MQIDTTAAQATRQAFWSGDNGLWLPPQESTTAGEIDAIFNFILYASIILTILVTVAMVYFIWKYRRRSHADRPVDVHESRWLEVSWIVVPTLLVLVVFFWGFRAYVATSIPPTDAIEIKVTAQKWAWTFEYDNGIQGFGEIYVPAGRPVKLTMTSQDILHSFFVPEFRIKHDVIPNRYSFVWFEAPEEGVYTVVCTEYCGTGHSNMGAKIHVVSTQEYYTILRDGPPSGGPVAPAALGERLYTQRNCVTCHSVDGSAGVGPSWLGIWNQPQPHAGTPPVVADEAYIVQSILQPQAHIVAGYENGNMPSYEGQLNEEQLAGLVAYIRLLNGAATAADTTLGAPSDSTATAAGAAAPAAN
jgi:cytochrome c oxidase subunit 2